jgi:hypothetical protein
VNRTHRPNMLSSRSRDAMLAPIVLRQYVK